MKCIERNCDGDIEEFDGCHVCNKCFRVWAKGILDELAKECERLFGDKRKKHA